MQQQQKKLRYVPVYDELGKMIDYHEVFFCRNDQEISLLDIEVKKNKIEYEKRLKVKNDLLEKEKLKKEEEIISLKNTISNRDLIIDQLMKRIDSLEKIFDQKLKEELSVSFIKPYGQEENI